MKTRTHLTSGAAALLLGIATALSGCVTPPKTEPQLHTIAGDNVGLGATTAPVVEERWWEQYGDAQFDRLVTAALESNPSLQQTLARLRTAQAQVQFATAQRQPGVILNGQEQRSRLPEEYLIPPPFGGGTYWSGQLLANLSWDLDFWGRQAALIDQAKATEQAVRLDSAAARLATTVALSETYLDLNRAIALADIAQQSLVQRQRILDITRKRIGAGLDTTVELREAESAVPQAELARLQAEAAREIAVHRLAALIGEGADAYEHIAKPTLDLETALSIPTELPADLLGRRPDVLAARARVEAATSQRAAARAAFYPNVNLSAFAGFQAIGLDNLLQANNRTYGAGPAISLPLFDSQRLKSQFNAATALQDEAVSAYNNVVLSAVQQVADQLSQVNYSARQLQQARATLDAAEEAYRLAHKRYEAGLANYLSVLTTETQVLNARTTFVDILHQQALARVSLLLAVGGNFSAAS
ncbi:efflux transporter outer membrane subunit [Steroidobacter sp. S1-65]|uniref:Efflux transporter outer membrane subunit n=1 Tax=Steroidobacter gossypii TaxID=2805490 RepID=A0ABS1WRK3_9GAMM|nr:efflux transporter outer membrane subunit [Steroidobacter gossypii]MBM0103592.1 efflux transporter outer membrane subunit [Steroidobacter gossypii]